WTIAMQQVVEPAAISVWVTSDARSGSPAELAITDRAPIWRDEFDGAAGAPYDPTKWAPETGSNGFGNQEREIYTEHDNAVLDGDGHLVITARAQPTSSTELCWYSRCLYTSGRIRTKER